MKTPLKQVKSSAKKQEDVNLLKTLTLNYI
jgi:hypothetical protein